MKSRKAKLKDQESVYTLEVVAELTGLPAKTIVHYQEIGLIAPGSSRGQRFSDEALRQLRRIEHLRHRYRIEPPGLMLVLRLIEDVERLQEELRRRR